MFLHHTPKHFLFLAVVGILAGCAGSPQAQISFISQISDNQYGFYWVDRDGHNPTSVTLQIETDYVTWSPDGRRLIYSNDREDYLLQLDPDAQPICLTCDIDDSSAVFSRTGEAISISSKSGLYVTDPDGSGQRQLADIPDPFNISWSPDGKFVAFVGGGGPSDWNIYRVDEDGSNLIKLTGDLAEGQCWGIQWSSTGGQIAFFDQDDGLHVMVMNRDGDQLTRVADWRVTSNVEVFEQVLGWGDLQWSPDGKQLAFPSASTPDNRDIFVVNADGSGLTNVSNLPDGDGAMAWSPDGKKLAFVSKFADDESDIFMVNADGSDLTNLTDHPGIDHDLVWSRDGAKIAFRTDRDGNWEIYVMNPDGGEPVNVSNSPDTNEFDPGWRSRSADLP